MTEAYAEDRGLAVGERLSLQSPSGEKRTVVVRGIYDPPADRRAARRRQHLAARRSTTRSRSRRTRSRSSTRGPEARTALDAAAVGFNDATFHTGEGFGEERTKSFASFLQMLYVLLAFSVVVSLFGMVNTLVLSVFERTRELGMLRPAGLGLNVLDALHHE